jgi:hypothetical protein
MIEDYATLPFALPDTPKIPVQDEVHLCGPISREDLDFYVSRLPRNKAPGPDGLPYELIKDAPDSLKDVILLAINSILTNASRC